VDKQSAPKLDAIAKALVERPGLKVVITGVSDLALDGPAVTSRKMLRAIRAQKIMALKAGEADIEDEDKVRVAPDEYLKYLRLACGDAGLVDLQAPPEGEAGKLSERERLEKSLREKLAATESDLKELNQQRVGVVKAYLLKHEGVPMERLFTREMENKEKKKESDLETGVMLGVQ